jgi:colanic acid/amylovoran biosynthesis glycosyltransferase
MKLAVIVTEYPKTTETFIYRDLIAFMREGVDVRLYHLAPYRHDQTLHGFAEPTRALATDIGFVRPGAVAKALRRDRPALAATLRDIVRAYAHDPRLCAKSLALVPKALAIAADARAWGASHVHAEFAGHPATAAWIGRRCGGLPYSVSCRAHDIFRTQALLDAKLGEAAAVRTVSAFGARFLRERVAGLEDRELHVIHSSVDVAAIEPFAVLLGPLRILYVGALEPKKGITHLIDALAIIAPQLGAWSCDLIGDGPDRAALQAQARAAGLGDHLFFHGAQPFERVARAYAAAGLCVAPSVIGPDGRQEGIPNVMIEALAHARPAIATAISGVPELIRDRDTGLLVPPGDAPALAAAILRIRDDPEAARAMAIRGRAHVEAEFDLATNARRQIALFADAQ